MDSVAVRKVNQLPSEEKRSLETLIGRRLEDNQEVFIMAFTPGVATSDQARQEALGGLGQTWEKVEQHRQRHGITDEEFDAAADEAVEHTRRRHA